MLRSHLASKMFGRIHELMEASALGLLPAGYPACSPACRCAAALNFLLLWLGWLLPTYLAARAQPWLAFQHAAHQGGTSLAPATAPPMRSPREQPAAVKRASSSCSSRFADWLLSSIFLHNAMLGMPTTAWAVLTGLCWLGGTAAALIAD